MLKVRFSKFVYTGNSSQGQNSGNYDEVERWAREAGLLLTDANLDAFWEMLELIPGTHTLTLGSETLRYTVQAHKGRRDSFGYTINRTLTAL